MQEMWMIWAGQESDQVDDYNFLAEQYPVINAKVGTGTIDNQELRKEIRRSEIRWVKDEALKNKMFNYAVLANRKAFGFDISWVEDIQHTKYSHEDEGYYNWHIDTFWHNNMAYDRKISVIIQLTDGNEYEGGDFLIDPQYPQPPKHLMRMKGTVFAFPSFIQHTVTPVTAGTRKSFVTWIEGPAFR